LAEKPKLRPKAKRPADVIGNAVRVMQIATGEVESETPEADVRAGNQAAVELGRLGGKARAKSLSKAERREIARNAAKVRWKTKPSSD
jgi:hypothetical protein